MLEKAKNQKIFLFFVFIILGFSLFIPFVSATITTESFTRTKSGYLTKSINTANWSSGVMAISAGSDPTELNFIQSGPTAKQYYYVQVCRGFLIFNTTSLPDDVYILDAYIRADISAKNDLDSDAQFSFVTFTPDSYTDLVKADFNNFGNSVEYTYYADDYISVGLSNISIPHFLINNDGYTGIGIRFESDRLTELNFPSTSYYPNFAAPSKTSSDSFGMAFSPSPILYITYTDEPPVTYIANFSVSITSGESPLYIEVQDTSSNFPEEYPYPTYIIDFDDGTSFEGDRQYTGEEWFHTYENPGIYTISYNITYDGTSYYKSQTITVTEGESNYIVQVHGLNTNPIGGANVSIWYDGSYKTSRGTYDETGNAYFNVPAYRFVNGSVTKPGYQTAYFDTYIYPENNLEFVTLYTDEEIPGSGDAYGNYIVTFKDISDGSSVAYSNIEVYTDSGYTTLFQDEYTNKDGIWTGVVPLNTTLYYKYPETIEYYSQIWSYNLTSPDGSWQTAFKTVNLIPKSGATSTTTPTPTTITTTITPTVTYTYNNSNLSTLNVKERFTNLLVLAGFQNAESADLIFAMIIVLGCTALIGWITLSGSGAGMGAIIGFVFSLGLGLIPLWLLIAAIYVACLYVALKLFGGSGE
jgi:hypothetical protein